MGEEREWELDPRRVLDLVRFEMAQRRETGSDTRKLERRFADADTESIEELRQIYEALLTLDADGRWDYEEPSDLASVTSTLPPIEESRRVLPRRLDGQALGAWTGRIVGCNIGKPVEAERWTSSAIREYLELCDSYPLLDYIPALDPMPAGFEFRESWPETTRGRVDGSARDDDIDYTILGLHLHEKHGADLETHHVAEAWVSMLPYHQVYTAERAAYRNLLLGLPLDEVPIHENPYREWIGAQIRGDMFGWARPGRPREAAEAAFRDASLSHTSNGIYGEMWVAALCADSFVAPSIPDAIRSSLRHIPPRSRLHEAIGDVLSMYEEGISWDRALEAIQERYGHYFIVHAVNNAAVVTAGLLWGEHDFARIVGLTIQGSWDTDSNGATAGSVAGAFLGVDEIPHRLADPLRDRVRSAVFGFDGSSIEDLAGRTVSVAQALAGQSG